MPAQPPRIGELHARDLRQRLGLDECARIPDVVMTIEQTGVPVFLTPLPNGISGLANRLNGRWYVVADTNGASAGRLRFTLAHELGHIAMGHTPSIDDQTTLNLQSGKHDQEVEANFFAAEFLVPRNAIEDGYRAAGHPTDRDAQLAFILEAARTFGTTRWVPYYRLKTLDLLDTVSFTVLRTRLQDCSDLDADDRDVAAQVAGSGATRMPAGHRERLVRLSQLDADEDDPR